MPLLNVRETDLFHLVAEEVTIEEWFYASSARRVTNDEWNEIQRLQAQTIRLQGLLKEIHERPEVELDDMTPEQRAACINDDEIAFGRD